MSNSLSARLPPRSGGRRAERDRGGNKIRFSYQSAIHRHRVGGDVNLGLLRLGLPRHESQEVRAMNGHTFHPSIPLACRILAPNEFRGL